MVVCPTSHPQNLIITILISMVADYGDCPWAIGCSFAGTAVFAALCLKEAKVY
jgi:hypothetical protein